MGILFNSITNQLYRYVLDANPIEPINRDPHIRCRAEWLGPVIDLTGVVRKKRCSEKPNLVRVQQFVVDITEACRKRIEDFKFCQDRSARIL